jgi:hypothetical protein
VQTLKFFTIPRPGLPRSWVSLDNLEHLALTDELDAVIETEGIG